MERVFLNCEYADRERAKAAGARWDPTAKRWWVPQELASDPRLAEFLPKPAPTVTFGGPRVGCWVPGALLNCWRCDRQAYFVMGLAPFGGDWWRLMLPAYDEMVTAEVSELVSGLAADHPVVGFDYRFSKTEKDRYFGQVCPHTGCGALWGRNVIVLQDCWRVGQWHTLAQGTVEIGLVESALRSGSGCFVNLLLRASPMGHLTIGEHWPEQSEAVTNDAAINVWRQSAG